MRYHHHSQRGLRLRWCRRLLTGALAGVLGVGACTESPRELYAPLGASNRGPAVLGNNPGVAATPSNGNVDPSGGNANPGDGSPSGGNPNGSGNSGNSGSGANTNLGSGSIIGDVLGNGDDPRGSGNSGGAGEPGGGDNPSGAGGSSNSSSSSDEPSEPGGGTAGSTGSEGSNGNADPGGGATAPGGGTAGTGSGTPPDDNSSNAGAGGSATAPGGGTAGTTDSSNPGGGNTSSDGPGGAGNAGGGTAGTGSTDSGGTSDPGSGETGSGDTSGGPPGTGGTDPGDTEPASDLGPCGAAPNSSAAFSRQALRAAAAQCARWHYCQFDGAAAALDARVQELSTAPSLPALESAQAAWRAAMASWSRVELFQFGPLGSRAESAGKDIYEGQGIRDLVYSWPSTARCRVEDQLISQTYATRGMDTVLISGKGLFGLEYLLFYPNGDTACAASSATATQWGQLDGAAVAVRKRAYAAAIASDVAAKARRLVDAWSPSGSNFESVFVGAGGAYPGEQEVMNVLAWSLVYVEREVKDWKLGVPAGYTLTSPVTLPETPFAGVATENLRGNLRGFGSLFQGCGGNGEGLGFDDWLIEAGHAELAADMLAAWERSRAAANAFPPLHAASVAQIDALYRTLKELTDLLKADFFGAGSPLNLELPGSVEGDTD